MDQCPDQEDKYQELEIATWRTKDNALDGQDLSERCPLDNGRHSPNPKSSLGRIGSLPVELQLILMSNMDLQSLTDFRRVNSCAMEVVDSLPKYRAIVEHAPNALRGMLSVGCARYNDCQTLYDTLRTAKCQSCANFGDYLYLITCKRVCLMCLEEKKSYLPLLKVDVTRKFGLNGKDLESLPRIRSRAGIYSPNTKMCRRPMTLYDHDAAEAAGIAKYGTPTSMTGTANAMNSSRLTKYGQKFANLDVFLCRKGKPRLPRMDDAFDAKSGNPYRFMAIVSMPHLDTETQRATATYYCLGCRDETDHSELYWRIKFTAKTFADHMERWGDIEDGLHVNSPNRWS